MEEVTLKNGAIEAKPLVVVTYMTLERLFDENPFMLADLYYKCKDDSSWILSQHQAELEQLSLIDSNENIHDSIKNIVLSSIEINGDKIKLVSPIKG